MLEVFNRILLERSEDVSLSLSIIEEISTRDSVAFQTVFGEIEFWGASLSDKLPMRLEFCSLWNSLLLKEWSDAVVLFVKVSFSVS